MGEIAKITSKGQITIPVAVRDDMGLHTGDRVEFAKGADGKYVLVKKTRTLDELFGYLEQFKLDRPLTDADIEQATAEEYDERRRNSAGG